MMLLSSIVIALAIQLFIAPKHASNFNEKKFKNPLYEEFVTIANAHNLDLSFTQTCWIERGPINYKINSIFKEAPKSVDILFIGDSSIAWGLIPRVISQQTGKKVAMYAYESNFLTQKTAKLFDKISKYYLKEDGIVILAFENSTQKKDPNAVHISKEAYAEIMQWEEKDFTHYAKKHERSLFDRYFSYHAFKTFYDETSEYLKTKYHLSLKSPKFYSKYVEPIINPKLAKNKAQNKNKETQFLRWDMDTITLYNPNFHLKSIHSEVMPKQPFVNKNVSLNAKASANIHGHKIYLIPTYGKHQYYKEARNMYYSYYQALGFELCDLGMYQTKEDAYLMQGGSHMGNTGGLMKSILMGKWLQEYYISLNP